MLTNLDVDVVPVLYVVCLTHRVSHQEPVLFTGSIKENIERGKPGASMAEIESAAKKAFAHEFITSFTVSIMRAFPWGESR